MLAAAVVGVALVDVCAPVANANRRDAQVPVLAETLKRCIQIDASRDRGITLSTISVRHRNTQIHRELVAALQLTLIHVCGAVGPAPAPFLHALADRVLREHAAAPMSAARSAHSVDCFDVSMDCNLGQHKHVVVCLCQVQLHAPYPTHTWKPVLFRAADLDATARTGSADLQDTLEVLGIAGGF